MKDENNVLRDPMKSGRGNLPVRDCFASLAKTFSEQYTGYFAIDYWLLPPGCCLINIPRESMLKLFIICKKEFPITSSFKYDSLYFGSAGIPHSSKVKSTQGGIERAAELGLTCMEIEFVQGVKMSPQSTIPVKEAARKHNLRLSAHGPYFINLNSLEMEKSEASKERILQSLRITKLCGGDAVIFHAGNYMGCSPEETYQRIRKALQEVINKAEKEDVLLLLLPEVTGKHSQFGTLEELLNLSQDLRQVLPCLDVAHWHARTNKFNSYIEFCSMLKQVMKTLGPASLENLHFHVSGIHYSKAGELKHLNLKESDFNYRDFIKALKDYRVKGRVICESPNLEEDALLLQETYRAL